MIFQVHIGLHDGFTEIVVFVLHGFLLGFVFLLFFREIRMVEYILPGITLGFVNAQHILNQIFDLRIDFGQIREFQRTVFQLVDQTRNT